MQSVDSLQASNEFEFVIDKRIRPDRVSIGCFRSFASTIPRKFGVRYNAYTLSTEVLDNVRQITQFASDIKGKTVTSLIPSLSCLLLCIYSLIMIKLLTCYSDRSSILTTIHN